MTILRGSQITDYRDDSGNRIIGRPKVNAKSVVEFKGENCTLIFGENAHLHGTIVFHRDNSKVSMGDSAWLRGRITLGLNCSIVMGKLFNSGPNVYMTTAESTSIVFGDDVLMARSCTLRTDDSHPIYDGVTGRRANKSKSITVGDHVWMGQEVILMPGSNIGSGSVLGARSMVTASRVIPANVIAVGAPAKVIRRKIAWVHKHLQTDTDVPESIEPVFSPDPVAEIESPRSPLARFFRR